MMHDKKTLNSINLSFWITSNVAIPVPDEPNGALIRLKMSGLDLVYLATPKSQ